MPPAPSRSSQLALRTLSLIMLLGIGGWFTATLPAKAQTALTPTTDAELLVLQQVAVWLNCDATATFYASGNRYSMACSDGAGHYMNAALTRYTTPAEAQAALTELHNPPNALLGCYVAAEWQYYEDPKHWAFLHRHHAWVANKWLVHNHSFDDYIISADDPLTISKWLVQAAQRQLFPACHSVHLPNVFQP